MDYDQEFEEDLDFGEEPYYVEDDEMFSEMFDYDEEREMFYSDEEREFDYDEEREFGDIVEGEKNKNEYGDILDSSDFGRISFGGGQYSTGDIRDPVNIAVNKLLRIIRNNYYDCLRVNEDRIRYIGEFLFSFEPNRILTMNMDVFAPAVLYLNEYKGVISKANLKLFIKRCDGLPYIGTGTEVTDGYLDLIRYIRMLKNPFLNFKI